MCYTLEGNTKSKMDIKTVVPDDCSAVILLSNLFYFFVD